MKVFLLLLIILLVSHSLAKLSLSGPDLPEVQQNIYSWSKVDIFVNTTFSFYSGLDNTFQPAYSSENASCLFLWPRLTQSVAREIIVNLPNTTQCVIVPSQTPELYFIKDILDTPFPVVLLINDKDGTLFPALAIQNNSIMGQFLAWEINTYPPRLGLHLFFSAANMLIDISCIIFGLVKLYDRYCYGLYRLNIATVCLTLEVIACMLREVAHILTMRNYLPDLESVSPDLAQSFYFMMLPFTLASGIFIIFFWIDITSSKSLYHGAFLDRCFWPAVALSVVCAIFIETISILYIIKGATWSSAYGNSKLRNGLLYLMFILLGTCSFIYFVAARNLHLYNKERKDSPLKGREMKKLIIKIIASGIVMLLIIIIAPIEFLSRILFSDIYISFVVYSLFSVRSYLLMDLFGTPPKQSTKSSATGGKTKATIDSTPPGVEL